jgi:phage terminase small subunit
MQAEPVTDREGKPTGVYTFNAGGALRALELLGKQRGMFVDRKEVRSGPLEEVTDDRLRELLARYAAAAGVSLPAVGGGAQGTNEPA